MVLVTEPGDKPQGAGGLSRRIAWRQRKRRRLYENRQRLPNALRALPRLAQIPASQGQHARRLGPREPPFADVGRQIHSTATVFCPLRSYLLQRVDGPDPPDHTILARGVWLHPRPVAAAPPHLLGSHRLADADLPRSRTRQRPRG